MASLPMDELLNAAAQLSVPELERFTHQVLALRARRQAPSLPQDEADLLLQISREAVPWDIRQRYDELVDKRRSLTLTTDEHRELIRLTNAVEAMEARRGELLADLARMRKTTLGALMRDLGLESPPVV